MSGTKNNNVVLDFSGVFGTSPQKPSERGTQQEPIITATAPKKRTEDKRAREQKIIQLLAEEEQQKKRTPAQQYQENIRRSGTLQSDILKGLAEGEDIHSLFLKAVEAVALMTNNNQLLQQAESDIVTVYGVGQGQAQPLRQELEAVEKRLFNLEESLLWWTDQDEQRRIQRAIDAHQRRAEKLRELIAESRQ